MFNYPVELKKDTNGTYAVSFPDVPEAHTFGETKAEALHKAVDALESALSFYLDKGEALPKASAKRGRMTLAPSLKGELKLAIYQAMRDGNVSKTMLMRRMGVEMMQVNRLLDLTHTSRLDQLESALAALGKRAHIELDLA